jgi:hypothetical protein
MSAAQQAAMNAEQQARARRAFQSIKLLLGDPGVKRTRVSMLYLLVVHVLRYMSI